MHKELAFSIILQAIEDYKLLQKYNADSIVEEHVLISKHDLEAFFNSDWCDGLLSLMSDLTGREILKRLKQ